MLPVKHMKEGEFGQIEPKRLNNENELTIKVGKLSSLLWSFKVSNWYNKVGLTAASF